MSGGQQQRVALAVLLAMNVDVLLLDEPFASCDPDARSFLISKLALLAKNGKTIILSDHVLDDYEQVCDHLFEFKAKTAQELSADEKEKYLYKISKCMNTNIHFLCQPVSQFSP